MENYVIYVDGKPLSSFPVVQNEIGVYYGKTNNGPYYKPLLKDFDNATPPKGYKKYTRGSHYKYRLRKDRNPLDFSIGVYKKITFSHKLKVISQSLKAGAWIKCNIVGTPYMIPFVHCYKAPKNGTIIKAGSVVCKIAPKSVTGNAVHLHIDEWTGQKIRNLILYGNFMGQLTKGTKLEQIEDMNVRDGTLLKVIGTAKKGSVCIIKSFHKEKNGYNYYNVAFGDKVCYIADSKFNKTTTKAVTNLDSSKVDTCQDKVIALEKEIKSLEDNVGALNMQINILEAQKKELQEANDELKKYKEYYEELSVYLVTKI